MNTYIITNDYFFYLGFSEYLKGLAKVKMLKTLNNENTNSISPNDIIFISKDALDKTPGIIIDALKLVNGRIANIFIDSSHPYYGSSGLTFKTYNSKSQLRTVKSIILSLYRERSSFSHYASLSTKETEVLFLLKTGMRGVDIAQKWSCSPKTVYTHKCHALKKTGAKRLSVLMNNIKSNEMNNTKTSQDRKFNI
ncbi:Response regulator [Escherichia coli]|uniref:helix-turn-helix transcriptional regulator n=1 Tax=Escherichia coli TaxID=562 RepID=UPI001918AA96|nr:LuxR C-terminal-related transcriptional regulator [Escherichia coli]CAD5758031.1 Response regulator [Escherichia coli]